MGVLTVSAVSLLALGQDCGVGKEGSQGAGVACAGWNLFLAAADLRRRMNRVVAAAAPARTIPTTIQKIGFASSWGACEVTGGAVVLLELFGRGSVGLGGGVAPGICRGSGVGELLIGDFVSVWLL